MNKKTDENNDTQNAERHILLYGTGMSIMIYLLLLVAESARPFDIGYSGKLIEAALEIAPPYFWAGGHFIVCILLVLKNYLFGTGPD